MRKVLWLFIAFSIVQFVQAQTDEYVEGNVFSVQTQKPISNVNILNLNAVKGTITDDKGNFKIKASVNDTLFFSFLGYKTIKIAVTNDMLKMSGTKIGMTELAYALEEVVITPFQLTGYLSIDSKKIPINNNFQYSISGLEMGYEGRAGASAIGRVFSAIFNPADFLYQTFSSKGKEMRKLKKMREDNAIRDMLATKFDRETLLEMLQISRQDLEEMLRHCNYSTDFMLSANDLQVLEAISGCYEEYRVLNKKK